MQKPVLRVNLLSSAITVSANQAAEFDDSDS